MATGRKRGPAGKNKISPNDTKEKFIALLSVDDMPKNLHIVAKKKWKEYFEEMPTGFFTIGDKTLLVMLCNLWHEYEQNKRDIKEFGRFDITASGRTMISAPMKIRKEIVDQIVKVSLALGMTPKVDKRATPTEVKKHSAELSIIDGFGT